MRTFSDGARRHDRLPQRSTEALIAPVPETNLETFFSFLNCCASGSSLFNQGLSILGIFAGTRNHYRVLRGQVKQGPESHWHWLWVLFFRFFLFAIDDSTDRMGVVSFLPFSCFETHYLSFACSSMLVTDRIIREKLREVVMKGN